MATLVVSKGLAIATGRMIGSSPTQAEPLNLLWGLGAGTSAASDESLFEIAPEVAVAGSSSQVTTTTTDDTYQVVGTITSAAGGTITNVGLFDTNTGTNPGQTTTTGINNVSTSLAVVSHTGFPGSGNYDIQVASEVMTVTAGQGTTTWTVTRGVNGSSAASHSSGIYVTQASGTNAGSMFLKSDFTGLVLNAGDSVTFTIQAVASA